MTIKDKQLCSAEDCYNTVTVDFLTERMADGTPHPLALRCNSCTTPEDIKKLSRFRKKRRKAERKANPLSTL